MCLLQVPMGRGGSTIEEPQKAELDGETSLREDQPLGQLRDTLNMFSYDLGHFSLFFVFF